MAGIRREWVAGTDFIMLHLDLVDALDGSYEAAALLNRIQFRAGDGWWEVSKAGMAADTRLSERKVDRAIRELRDAGFVESERASHMTSRLRWRVVFDTDLPGSSQEDETSRTRVTSVQVADEPGQRWGTKHGRTEDETSRTLLYKNYKKEPSARQPTLVDVSSPDGDAQRQARPSPLDVAFDEWYALYPIKKGKQAARRAYAKAARQAPTEAIIAGLRSQLASMQVLVDEAKREGRRRPFIVDPARWLNDGSWEDEYRAVDNRTREQRDYDEGYR